MEYLNLVWENKKYYAKIVRTFTLGIRNIICSPKQATKIDDVLRKKFWEEYI
jgi:hypothetical protein